MVEAEHVFFAVTDVRFFLEKDIELYIGDPFHPEKILKVANLSFPKLRVNFNGYRLKTNIKSNNWSTFYVINEEQTTNSLTMIKLLDKTPSSEVIEKIGTEGEYTSEK